MEHVLLHYNEVLVERVSICHESREKASREKAEPERKLGCGFHQCWILVARRLTSKLSDPHLSHVGSYLDEREFTFD